MTPTNPTDAQMKLAREYACQAVEVYGEGDAREHDASVLRTLWNDHPAVQSALLAIQATEARAQGLVDALEDSKRAVQAFLDMVNVMQRVQALPIPVFLETAQHNCPIILQNLDQALATWRRT